MESSTRRTVVTIACLSLLAMSVGLSLFVWKVKQKSNPAKAILFTDQSPQTGTDVDPATKKEIDDRYRLMLDAIRRNDFAAKYSVYASDCTWAASSGPTMPCAATMASEKKIASLIPNMEGVLTVTGFQRQGEEVIVMTSLHAEGTTVGSASNLPKGSRLTSENTTESHWRKQNKEWMLVHFQHLTDKTTLNGKPL